MEDGGRQGNLQGSPEVRDIAVADLCVTYSPRHERVDEGHLLALMEVMDDLPPIIVDKRTNRVIDGVHRLEAFRRAGRTTIRAVLFCGDQTEALALAIRANVTHGKPLSLNEREAGAAELLLQCPERSDRWVASICALSHSTVGGIRRAVVGVGPALRIGRDGRSRAVGTPDTEATKGKPDRTVGKRTRAADLSSGGLGSGAYDQDQEEAQVLAARPTNQDTGAHCPEASRGAFTHLPEVDAWFARTDISTNDLDAVLGDLPLGRLYEVADECRRRTRIWIQIADALETRGRSRQGARRK